MMARIIGLAVSRTEVRAIGTRRGEIVWTHRVPRDRDATLASSVERLLEERPATLASRTRLIAVIGATDSQLRPLSGLPHVKSSELDAMIAQNADRFFMQTDGRLRISSPHVNGDGETWAGAVNADVVDQISRACRTASVRFDGVVPVAAILQHIVRSDESGTSHAEWDDDGTCLDLTYSATGPVRITRTRSATAEPTLVGPGRLPEGLETAYADAYAATLVKRGGQFVIAAQPSEVIQQARARVRVVLWSIATLLGILVAAWVPGAQSTVRAKLARSAIASLARKDRELKEAERDLHQATTAVNAISTFESSRRSMTILLAELSLAIPDSTAVTTLRIDSLAGLLSVLTTHAAGTLDAMSTLSGISRAQLAGSVTREITAGKELERATIRFTLAAPHRDARPPLRAAGGQP